MPFRLYHRTPEDLHNRKLLQYGDPVTYNTPEEAVNTLLVLQKKEYYVPRNQKTEYTIKEIKHG